MITITLRGDPGHRTGTVRIGPHYPDQDQIWHLATWHRQAGGEVHATTDDGVRVTLALDAGRGGITIGREFWFIDHAKWTGTIMTGETRMSVSDAEMANMFPDCSCG